MNKTNLSPKEIDAIRIEVAELKQAFERWKEKTKTMPGSRNRIEDGLARIERIEKHLDIEARRSV